MNGTGAKKFQPKKPLYSEEQFREIQKRFESLLKFPPGSEKLQKDLIRYRDKALEIGALESHIVPASAIVQEYRVWWKCLSPRWPISPRICTCR